MTTENLEDANFNADPPALVRDMFGHPERFTFFQTLSLLRRLDRIETRDRDSEEDFLRKRVRVDGYLSLAFPPNDVAGMEIERDPVPDGETAPEIANREFPAFVPGERIRLSATFMGLYGSASPLPTFYTEELLDDRREDLSAAKSFLDLVGHLFFVRYYQAMTKYRLLDRLIAEEDGANRMRLFCLVGVGDRELLGGRELTGADVGCTGLLSLRQRSASALMSYLAVRFGVERADVEIEQCVASKTGIAEWQRACLGGKSATLGEDAVLGSEIVDRMGSFRISLRRLDADAYHSHLPMNDGWEELRRTIGQYVSDPLRFEVTLHLKPEEVRPARLSGREWRTLGEDAFLPSSRPPETDQKGCRLTGVC